MTAPAPPSGIGQIAIVEGPRVVARLSGREIWMSFWRDSEGNLMAFMQETPAA